MNCAEARLRIGAEPGATPSELLEHLQGCRDCAEFQLEMLALESHIRRVLAAPLPATRASRPLVAQPRWALAATVLVAALATLGLWALRPTNSLAREVVAHVVAEPQSWIGTDAVSQAALSEVLHKTGVVLEGTPYSVVYARSCVFRGHNVPHLVVRTPHSLMTVLILPDEVVSRRQSFHEEGLSGIIVPSAHGSIAVLANSDRQLDDVAARMLLAVRSPVDAQ